MSSGGDATNSRDIPDATTKRSVASPRECFDQSAGQPPTGVIDYVVPQGLEIRLVQDNYAIHEHAKVEERLSEPPR